MAIDDYLGDWIVKRADSAVIQKGATITISSVVGTDDQVALTYTDTNQPPETWRGTYHPDTNTIFLDPYVDKNNRKVEGQISMLKTETGYECAYGTAIVADPEEAGVWGGERP